MIDTLMADTPRAVIRYDGEELRHGGVVTAGTLGIKAMALHTYKERCICYTMFDGIEVTCCALPTLCHTHIQLLLRRADD